MTYMRRSGGRVMQKGSKWHILAIYNCYSSKPKHHQRQEKKEDEKDMRKG
jgi:hypothetical protein